MDENEVFEETTEQIEEGIYEEPLGDDAPTWFSLPTAIAATLGGIALGAVGAKVVKPVSKKVAEKTQGIRKSLRERRKERLEKQLNKIYEAEAVEQDD